MSGDVRVAIIGTGFIGRDHAAAYRAQTAAELVGVADSSNERVMETAEAFGVRGFVDYREMLESVRPDAVSICVPTALHLPVVRDVAATGAAILLEKPMGASVEECDDIGRACRSTGVLLMLGFTHRFHRELMTAKALIADGRLGQVMLAHDFFSFGEDGPWPSWYYSRTLSGGGELMHDGVHLVDRLAWLIGSPIVEVYGRTSAYARDIDGVEDGAAAVLTFANGAVASLFVNESTHPLRSDATTVPMPGRSELELHGSLGSVLYRTWHELVIELAGEGIQTIVREDSDEMEREIGEFVTALLEDRPPAVGYADGRRGVAVVQSIYASERERQPIRVDELYPVPDDLRDGIATGATIRHEMCDFMNAAERYLTIALEQVSAMARSQAPGIEQAAGWIADALADHHRLWVAATSHVLHTELWLRAGGLAAVHQLGGTPDLSKPMYGMEVAASLGDGRFEPEHGDVAMVGTNAGTDAGTVELAVAASRAGCRVIALTSVEYESAPEVVPEHPTGKKLIDVADLVIDIGGPAGDAVMSMPGLPSPMAPTSGVVLVAFAWAILARSTELLGSRGVRPIVYRSVQLPGAEAEFQATKARYERTRVGVEPIDEPAGSEESDGFASMHDGGTS